MNESKIQEEKRAEAAMAEVGVEEGGAPDEPEKAPLEVVKEIVEEVVLPEGNAPLPPSLVARDPREFDDKDRKDMENIFADLQDGARAVPIIARRK